MLHSAPLVGVAAQLLSGHQQPGALLDEVCARIDRLDPQLCALVPEEDRSQRLRSELVELEARYPEPARRPPLFSVPLGVKDILRVDGLPTRAGSRLPAEVFIGPEAACVTTLRTAGALVLGKTVSAEFAYFAPGPTRNPWNLAHTPGGSSSGSAAAVAAGFCPLALGTQTIGSVLRPAAFCGIVGFKPTYERISTAGLVFCAPSLDTIGFFTQDVAGSALAAGLLCRDWMAYAVERPPVLGVPDGPYLQQASPEGLAAFEAQLVSLQAAGVVIRRIPTLESIATIAQNNFRLMYGEMARTHEVLFAQYADLYHQRTADAIREGQEVSDDELAHLLPERGVLRTNLEGLMQEYGIDLWACPAAPGPAPLGLESTGNSAMNLPWTFAGMPAIAVPAGRAGNGLPLGLQLIAPSMADERLIAWAEQLEPLLGSSLSPSTGGIGSMVS